MRARLFFSTSGFLVWRGRENAFNLWKALRTFACGIKKTRCVPFCLLFRNSPPRVCCCGTQGPYCCSIETAERTTEWGADGRRVQFETKVCANKHYIYCAKWATEGGHLWGLIYMWMDWLVTNQQPCLCLGTVNQPALWTCRCTRGQFSEYN